MHTNFDTTAVFARIDPVAHGVLHEREQRRRRATKRERGVVDVQLETQAIGNAHVHQLEIGADELQLAADRHRGLVQQRDSRAQIGDQTPQHGGSLR